MVSVTTKRQFPGQQFVQGPRLIGYLLTTRQIDNNDAAVEMLQRKCQHTGFTLAEYEIDIGLENNPIRPRLWHTFRHLVCYCCESKSMPSSLMNLEDWLCQAFMPCNCKNPIGFDGIVVGSLQHFCSDPAAGTAILLKLAQMEKHFIADDSTCLSCCHPGTRSLIAKSQDIFNMG